MNTKNDKLAYVEKADIKLAEMTAKLYSVKHQIREAVVLRQIDLTEQLINAERQADSHLRTVRDQLEKMQQDDDESWQRIKSEIDGACDDLSQSINRLISRFS